ncbi:1,2-dihydroxy-3-keto-5-methylthiopentene dioxygenase (plasmid) [Klebsiella sp. WOUb02]|uniref:1,2-dihydroxy-3-keto-5-methylthiopentene dioxygenase n=1 Tax=Klebsiella sp. WOUb02 TaxID=3161071 RepID=UPI003CF9628B
MTSLSIYKLPDTTQPAEQIDKFDDIVGLLAGAGIRLEHWESDALPDTSDDEALLSHFQRDIDRLKRLEGYTAADVIRITPEHPDREVLRKKFLQEHTHSEDEVRFFVTGSGTFFVPLRDKVFRMTCKAGDLLRVPADTRHWFDCGEPPDFTAIRIFTNPAGWVGHFTGRETFH